ncbi:TIGR01777 family oxidoreductase [Nonomuraea sp. NPDC050556]|uniref:TIGR01777 family oxidoreductase n=1 Tax=Nonomuraea sp. NPDC050556 TaxID=3364369 RepID=UPI003796BEC6
MAIFVSGASGLLGSALSAALRAEGERVVALVRRPVRGEDEVFWDPAAGSLDPSALEGATGVVHLAGAGVGDRRWTSAYKREIVMSRVNGTRTLVGALTQLKEPPEVFVSASGQDFYGDTGDRVIDESAPKGSGFLADLCEVWESEAAKSPCRNVQLRTSLVLSGSGGALGRMLPVFRVGLGAPLGSGRQYWAWIAVEDWVRATVHILRNRDVSGPVNMASTEPVTNARFTTALGKAMGRPTMPIPVPGFALSLALGEFAGEALLPSHRLQPKKLVDSGYMFLHTRLDEALSAVL